MNDIIRIDKQRCNSSVEFELNGETIKLGDLAEKLNLFGNNVSITALNVQRMIRANDFNFNKFYEYFMNLSEKEKKEVMKFYGLS